MDRAEVWEVARQIIRGFMAQYGDAMDEAATSMGLDPSVGFVVIIPAYLFEPDPISAARLRKKVPYNSPAYYDKPLLTVKDEGFLDEVPEGGYILNQTGHEAFKKIMDAAYQQMESLSLLPSTQMDELTLLLAKLVQASILFPEPVSKWGILHSRRLDPGRSVVSAIKIDQYLADLSCYRDDAHLASWSSYSMNAHAWDILGIVWEGRASSIANVMDLAKKRCWTKSETHKAIDELVERGWIIMREEKLILTEEGRRVRDDAEALTDRLFFSPWDVLTDNEYKRLCELLTGLNECLVKSKIA